MADLILLTTLERLHPHDGKTTFRAFGLSLSVALEPGTIPDGPLAKSFLQPWTWDMKGDGFQPIQKIRFFPVPEIMGVPWVEEKPEPGPQDHSTPDRQAFRNLLESRFKTFPSPQDQKTWSWNDEIKKNTTVSRTHKRWPAFVGEVSLMPYPLPQGAGLSYFVKLRNFASFKDGVVAAPVLRLQQGGRTFELEPKALSFSGSRVTISYEDPKDITSPTPPASSASGSPPPASPPPPKVSVVVETVVCDMRDPAHAKTEYFDFGTLWVDLKKDDIASTDWRSGLELRIAEQLNLARTILELEKRRLQSASTDDRPKLAARGPEIAGRVLNKLLDLLGPGTNEGPEGVLLDRARFFWRDATPPRTFSEPAFKEVKRVVDTWIKDPINPDQEFKRTPSSLRLGWVRQAITGKPPADTSGSGLFDAVSRAENDDQFKKAPEAFTLEQILGELDQTLAVLFTPDTLRSFFRIQWQAFLDSKPTLSTEALDFVKSLAGELPPQIDLQRLLLLDHLGNFWKNPLRPAFRGQDIKTIRTDLEGAYRGIIEKRIPESTDEEKDNLASFFLERTLPDGTQITKLEPRRTKGLTFQLDTLSTDLGEDDRLTRIQGLGVLMQRKGETEWHCLNLASAGLGNNTKRILLPARLAYLNDLRSPTVTYDNGPLTVESPLSPHSIAGTNLEERVHVDAGEPAAIDELLVKCQHAKDSYIPGLVFGKTYRIAAFMVTNSGAIPEPLSEGSPWNLRANIKDQHVKGAKQEATYLREMHVGSLRVQPDGLLALPPIPANVAPRVRELSPGEVLPEGDPLFGDPERPLDSTVQTDSLLAKTPLVLLAESFPARPGIKLDNSISLKVSPPTVDLQTWDRWVAMDVSKEQRKFIWRSYYELSYEKGEVERNLENAGVYLDDPAVVGVWVELSTLPLPLDGGSLNAKPVSFNRKSSVNSFEHWDTDPCTLASEQHSALPVHCLLAGKKLTVTIGPKEAPLETLTATGDLFRLSFYAALKKDAEEKFLDGKENVRNKDFKGTSPWHLLIEVPQALPADKTSYEKAVLDALEHGKEQAVAGKLSVGLDLNKLPNLSKEQLQEVKGRIYRAEVWQQVWHWRGRPPAEPILQGKDLAKAFEMAEFGPRSDDEHRRLPMPRQTVTGQPEPKFVFEEDLDLQGPQGDRRALAHRFSARVFSRWEGILPEDQSYFEAFDSATQNRWVTHFVPCRHQGDVPAPKVKMVLPLTQGVSENPEDGPGLLVVVDGPWYEVGGLAERLGVEVMTVSDPEVKEGEPPKPEQEYFQIGTDPIVTGDSAGTALGIGSEAVSLKEFQVAFTQEGAIGHHRDHSETDPRFLASSFLLSRPTISRGGEVKEVNLAWWFLKLRFRRELDVEGRKDPLASDWSAPFWVQILPGVERVGEDWFGKGSHEVSLKKGELKVRGTEQPFKEGFHLFAVMTRKVSDFAGRPDQEVYLGVWSWDLSSKQWRITDDHLPLPGDGDNSKLYLRLLEVQSPALPKLDKGDGLWDSIFKPSTEDAKRARITRISNRLEVNGRPS